MDIRFDEEAKIFKSVKKNVYVCHGENEFLLKELAKKILYFLMPEEEQATGLIRFDGNDEDSLDRIIDAALSPSLFAPHQVIYIDNAQAFKLKKSNSAEDDKKLSDEEKFSNYSQYTEFLRVIGQQKSTVNFVMVCCEDLKRPTSKTGKSRSEKMLQRCYAELDRNGALVHFPKMFDDDLTHWIQDRARGHGVRLNAEQAEQLLEWAGRDVRHLASEIEKIAVFSEYGEKFDSKEFRKLITNSEDVFVFQLVDYMFSGRAKAALGALRRSIEGGSAPVYIVAIISGRLRQLWQARYLLERKYFPNLPDEYKFGAKAAIMKGLARITEADRSVLSADKSNSILSKTPLSIYSNLMPARRYSREKIEAAISTLMDVERRLKGITRPKHGSDEIMLQNFIVDIAKSS